MLTVSPDHEVRSWREDWLNQTCTLYSVGQYMSTLISQTRSIIRQKLGVRDQLQYVFALQYNFKLQNWIKQALQEELWLAGNGNTWSQIMPVQDQTIISFRALEQTEKSWTNNQLANLSSGFDEALAPLGINSEDHAWREKQSLKVN